MGNENPKAPEVLTPKRERFCEEYLKDLNGTQAAIRAGYSKRTAQQQASDLLLKPLVSERIAKLRDEATLRAKVDVDTVLRELLGVATFDIGRCFDAAGVRLDVHEIPEAVRKAISAVEIFEEFEGHGEKRERIGQTVRIKVFDKVRSLELLGKYLKMFVERVQTEPPPSLRDLLQAVKDRKAEAQAARALEAAAAAAKAAPKALPKAPPGTKRG